jgi:dTDP-4-dehydrorhamnose 3,5-epimerase
MKITETPLADLKSVELDIYGDERGFFVERFNKEKFKEHGLPTEFFQDNHSRSEPGVLRGLHLQFAPAQGKLVGVTRGNIWDVAVDVRANSPTFGQHFSIELSDSNGKLLWVPAGFAHGFYVSAEELTDVLYKVDAPYQPESEQAITWNDPSLDIPWPITVAPIISKRDQDAISWDEYCHSPKFM